MNDRIYGRLAGHALTKTDRLSRSKWIVDAYQNAGYDYATIKISDIFYFPQSQRESGESVSLNEGSMIQDWESFDAYQWPDADALDFNYFHDIDSYIPGTMKVIVPCKGVQENLIDIVGFNNLCYLFYENPNLVQAVADKIGEALLIFYQRILSYPAVGSVICSDDWGYKTQTMFSPEVMARYIFPWHKKIVDLVHQAGRPIILHSCGNLSNVMNTIIELGYDAKHSFEDEIQSVEEAYEMYGDRIAILGGIDVDFMCRESIDAIQKRCITMLERAEKRGGYALGSGNSIPEYLPDEKYLAMISTIA